MTLPSERTMAVFSMQALAYKCISARNGGFKGIPKAVREEFRRVMRHYPLGADLLQPDAFCRDTIQRWAAEMDRSWRCDEAIQRAATRGGKCDI